MRERERGEERKAKTDIRSQSVRNAAGISMWLRVGGESAGSRGRRRLLMVGRIFQCAVADRGSCIMAEVRGTSLDNSSPDSAVWRDTGELVRASLPVQPRSHRLHHVIYTFITSSGVWSSYEGGAS